MGLRRALRHLKRSVATKKKIYFYNRKESIFDAIYEQELTNAEIWLAKINQHLETIKISSKALNNISLIKNDSIPKLAWCIKLSEQKTIINYGADVYRHENGIIEGVWDDNFDELDYVNAKHVFGSGISINGGEIILTPPSHMYECIFCIHNESDHITYLSNSLCYLLSLIKMTNLFEAINNMRVKNDEITKSGVLNFDPLLFKDEYISLYGFYYHNVIISSTRLHLSLRENITKFSDFNSYSDYLLETMKKLIKNSNSSQRKIVYTPLSSISKGYDSPAVSCLLKKLGNFETVTVNVNIYGTNDSGIDISNKLQMECHECSHPLGNTINNLNEIEYPACLSELLHEFIATIGLGDDLVFFSFDQYLKDKVIFSGALGDTIWACGENPPPLGIPVRVPFGKSLSEYRLRKGFIHIPLPVIGAVFPYYIYRINFLKAMLTYHVNNKYHYNRPIARRIIEDSGITRGMFANTKNAINPNPVNLQIFKKKAFEHQIAKYSFINQFE